MAKLNALRRIGREQAVRFVPYIMGIAVFIIIPPFLPLYFQGIMTKIFIFAIVAISLDIIFGYSALWSLGHAVYFGAAAYTTGILIVRVGIESFLLVAPVALLVAGLLAMMFGLIALRGGGVYFLILTLALGELTFSVAWRWTSLTGGDSGIASIPAMMGVTSFYYFVLLTFLVCFYLLYRLINSPFGGALEGIRDSEPRMRCLGYNTWIFKYIAFVISGVVAGVAGVVFASYNGCVVPDHVGLVTSAQLMIMVMLGGAGTLFGPALGAALIVILEQIASVYMPQRWPLILGATFVICAMFARNGLWLQLVELWSWARLRCGSTKG
jgi:branched-chain amino acid transport system permease protein